MTRTTDRAPSRVPIRSELRDALRERYGRDLASTVRARLRDGAQGLDLADRSPDASISLRLDDASADALEAIADESGLSRNEVLVRIFESLADG